MRKFLFVVMLLSSHADAQTVQWASEVLEFSSQLTANQYSAKQILGKPTVLPGGGTNPGAWTPDKPKRKEFIKVSFDKPMAIRQVAIAESFNPSTVYKIVAYDEQGNAHTLETLSPVAVPLKSRMLNVFVELTPYKVSALRLEFDGAVVSDYFAIDAIGISDSKYLIIADIPQAEAVAAGIIVASLDKTVNSTHKELNPLLSPDGRTMYFSRQHHPDNIGGPADKEDIWYSELDDQGNWTMARNMGPGFNNESPNFINTILSATPDGRSMILVLGNKSVGNKTQAGVSISSNTSGTWSKPKGLTIVNEYNTSDNANYFLTNNRITLLMSVQRMDTKGDRDMYVSFMHSDSVWTEPLNLGSVVNTVADDISPFLAIDNKTLYFSSKGFSGFGGFDVFMTRRLDDTWTNWSVPVNMGKTINSPFDDLYFNLPGASEYSYYSRGVDETNTDIYQANLPPELSPEVFADASGKLIDAKTDLPLGATIVYERLPDGKRMGIMESDSATGEFNLKLPMGYFYGIHAEAANYISESQNLDLRNLRREKKVNLDFRLNPIEIVPIEAEAVVSLNSVFFDFNKSVLKPESFPELDRVAKLMQERAGLAIEVDGHTDDVGTSGYNQLLSENRANAVKMYLLSKGIHNPRITTVGFGETQPLVSNDDEQEGRAINRRVEFKILKNRMDVAVK
jgi:OOP family OmpA-OmpF porin